MNDCRSLRVAVVDDHPVVRYGIQHMLGFDAGVTLVCALGSLAEMLDSGCAADVVVLDLFPATGRVPQGEIEALAHAAAVLVFSSSIDEGDVLAAFRAGARGYVTKNSTMPALVEAIRTVAAGGRYLSADVPRSGAHELAPGAMRLAPREREALSLIACGYTQAQTAARMGVSAATVDTYLKRIRHKLGAGNKADLTRRALALGEVVLPWRATAHPVGRSAGPENTGPDALTGLPHI
jgi:DNA-binding NarL/FixJ family response regulator